MFARWDSEQDCLAEMLHLHDEETATSIVAEIAARVNAGTLFKSDNQPMQIISKADSDELVVYGPCSWELRDPEGDVVTTAGMIDFFKKWFIQVPEEYRCVMLDHGNFKVGVPLLTYEGKDRKYATHVHEKGAMLISRLRPDDGLRATKKFREDVLLGVYKSYSICWWPIRYEMVVEDEGRTEYHYELDPVEVTICRYGMNEMAKFNIVKRYNPQFLGDIMERLEKLEQKPMVTDTTDSQSKAYVVDVEIPQVEKRLGKPLPTPNDGESESAFISRCVSALTDAGEGEDNEQRVAMCYSQWREHDKAGPRTDAERAMAHFNLTQEEWDALSEEEQADLIAALPDRGEGGASREDASKVDLEIEARIGVLAHQAFSEITNRLKDNIEKLNKLETPPAKVSPSIVETMVAPEEVEVELGIRILAHKAFKDAFKNFI